MASLRDIRKRISSVKNTQQVTRAMKMVAAAKLRRAQEAIFQTRPYAYKVGEIISHLKRHIDPTIHPLFNLRDIVDNVLLVVVTADRGLCGGFNSNLARAAKNKVLELQAEGKEVSLVCVGRKGRDALRGEFGNKIWESFTGVLGSSKIDYADAAKITDYVLEKLEAGEFDVCSLVYNEFVSVLTQKPTVQQLIPFSLPEAGEAEESEEAAGEEGVSSPYSFEPEEEEILNALLPRNLGVQVFRALLDSAAGEHAARMTAMDNSTRNAGEMIDGLTLEYNRARQAQITKELIEIISGAEAV